jgi:hypothetical protein
MRRRERKRREKKRDINSIFQ